MNILITADYLNNIRSQAVQHHLSFPGSARSVSWSRWRKQLRQKLSVVLGLKAWGPITHPAVKIISARRTRAYICYQVQYETLPGNLARAFLLIPRFGPKKKPAVLCPHGHVKGGAKGVIDPSLALGTAYGHEFAELGAVVLAPYNAGNGIRDVKSHKEKAVGVLLPRMDGCDLLWRRLNHLGMDLTGLRIFELMAALNILESLDEVAPHKIGAAGLSGGCWLSQVLAALDSRIQAVVLSGYFSTFAQTAWLNHCICHHPKGIGLVCEMYDIAALIAPRPLYIESGTSDTLYPVEPAYSFTRKAFQLVGAESNLHLERYQGGHMFYGKKSIPWLIRQLSGLKEEK